MVLTNQHDILSRYNQFLLVSLTSIACIILFIWAIPNTIALRNILLVLGSINSVLIFFKNSELWIRVKNKWLPLFFLGMLYLWVLLHYHFFTLNQAIEWSEIKSIWIRAFAGCLIALAMPICFRRDKRLKKYFYLFLFSTPTINIMLYIFACFSMGKIIAPQDYVADFLFKKIETVFFGSLAGAFAAANINFLFTAYKKNSRININLEIFFWIFGLVICFVSSVLSNTKNGILILLFIVFLLVTSLATKAVKKHKNPKSIIVLLVGLLLFSFAALRIHTYFSTGGWSSLISDVKIAVNIDDYLQWRVENHDAPLPINENGSVVSGSTYMRVAWAMVGIRLIGRYPFGYGSINASYDGLLNLDGSDPGQHGQTHSGWIDFGLAYGIPGLTLLFAALITGIVVSRGVNLQDRLEIIFLMTTFIPLSIIAETAWKQYFEATLFFIAYASALLILKQDNQ